MIYLPFKPRLFRIHLLVIELVEIPNNKSQMTSKYQWPKSKKPNPKKILMKGKQIEEDIFIITGKLKLFLSFIFGIWSLYFGIYLQFDAYDLLFPIYQG